MDGELITEKNISIIDIHQKIIDLKKDIEASFIKMGGYLKLVRDNKLYIDKGCETFEEYIGMPELSFSRSMVYSLIGVYEDFIENNPGVDPGMLLEIGYYKLDRIRQFKGKNDFEEWIYKAKTLSLSDLNMEINEAKGKETKIEKKREIITITCPYCGKKFEYIVKD